MIEAIDFVRPSASRFMVSGPLLGARAGRTVVLRLLADSNLKNFR